LVELVGGVFVPLLSSAIAVFEQIGCVNSLARQGMQRTKEKRNYVGSETTPYIN